VLELKPNWILCPNCKTQIFDERNKPDDALYITQGKESDKKEGGILLILEFP
jgi:hypothetical protein